MKPPNHDGVPLWEINEVQFPRLLAEIRAISLTPEQYSELCDAMDLSVDNIDELLERAEYEWQMLKERHRHSE